ncbi:MAG: hypothetical protein NC320_09610 [Clostridium sp.]|nr:hypothetical protein [Clostridium sp.]MCM1547739.1 hypothetical protein [Ruminococcus sp.]
MKKSVYSLVLSDDVVRAIDDLAYGMNTSRSNLINQILAEHVSYRTPESIIKDIFSCMESIMDSHFHIQGQTSDAVMSIRSPLRYKYKPTIRYKVELLKDPDSNNIGTLSVSFRTQNIQLISLLEGFFRLWRKIENAYIGKYFKDGVEYAYKDGKFVRRLKISNNIDSSDPDTLGKAIVEYIRLLDREIKIYFENIGDINIAGAEMEKLLSEYIKSDTIII